MPVTTPPTFKGGYSNIAVGNAGQILTSNGAGSAPSFQAAGASALLASKPVDTTRTSSSIIADPDLQFPALAAGRYALEAVLHLPVQNPQGGIAPGFFTDASITTGYFMMQVADSSGTDIIPLVTNVNSQLNVVSNASKQIILHMIGTLVTSTAGLLSLSWGTQNGTNPTTVTEGSWMRVTKTN